MAVEVNSLDFLILKSFCTFSFSISNHVWHWFSLFFVVDFFFQFSAIILGSVEAMSREILNPTCLSLSVFSKTTPIRTCFFNIRNFSFLSFYGMMKVNTWNEWNWLTFVCDLFCNRSDSDFFSPFSFRLFSLNSTWTSKHIAFSLVIDTFCSFATRLVDL